MEVNPAQLLENGYIVLPGVIPPEQLDQLRRSFELWLNGRGRSGQKNVTLRIHPVVFGKLARNREFFFNEVVDQATDNTVRFCLHQNTLGVSQKLMSATGVAVTLMALMCRPVKDHGPASWHRDIDPVHQAPLNGMQMDMMETCPVTCNGTSHSMTIMCFGLCLGVIVVLIQRKNISTC